jgi:hypothetical protein
MPPAFITNALRLLSSSMAFRNLSEVLAMTSKRITVKRVTDSGSLRIANGAHQLIDDRLWGALRREYSLPVAHMDNADTSLAHRGHLGQLPNAPSEALQRTDIDPVNSLGAHFSTVKIEIALGTNEIRRVLKFIVSRLAAQWRHRADEAVPDPHFDGTQLSTA